LFHLILLDLKTCGSETGRTTLSHKSRALAGQLYDISCLELLEDQLSDTVPWTDDERIAAVCIEQDNLQLTGIVRVNDAGETIQAVLYGQSRTRCNATIGSGWELDSDTGRDNHSMAWQDNIPISGKEVITSGAWGCARRKNCMRYQLTDIEGHFYFERVS
jgi:hypothetical protein